nr:cuticle protein 16.5-like [Penaeus vannamei]
MWQLIHLFPLKGNGIAVGDQCKTHPRCIIMKFLVLFGVIAAALAAPVPDEKVVAVHGAVAPAALTYGAHALTHAVAPGAVSYAAPAVHHAVAPAAVSYAAPAVHHAVAPAVAYAAPTPVALPPAEVKVPVTRTHVEVPVHQKVHYGTQNYVAGATTTIHKPSLAAPAIAPPSTLLAKVTHNAPELTIQRQEVPVEKHTPNFVDTPYHAGTIVKYTEPEVREVKVPTPYAQPVAVPQPIPCPAPARPRAPRRALPPHCPLRGRAQRRASRPSSPMPQPPWSRLTIKP